MAQKTKQDWLMEGVHLLAEYGSNNIKIDWFEPQSPAISPLIPAARDAQPDLSKKGPARLPVKISCSIHPWMAGYLLVRANPYMAVSDKTGTIKLENLPPGRWEFQFWHERSGYLGTFSNRKPFRRGRTKLEIVAGKTTNLKTLMVPVAKFQN